MISIIQKSLTIIFVAIISFATLSLPSSAQNSKYDEYRVKAAFMYNFMKFTEWPESSYENDTPVIVCIFGEDPFGDRLDNMKKKTVHDRQIEIKYFKSAPEEKSLTECTVLFLYKPLPEKQMQAVSTVLNGHSILTIGDFSSFAENWGIISFISEDEKIRFKINPENARKSGLMISSKLLSLSKIVR